MTDKEILNLYTQRAESAVSETNKKYRKRCYDLSYHILNNREDSDECINDAYLVLWNNIPPDSPPNLLAYLLKVVKNISLKKYEYNTAQKRGGNKPEMFVALDEIENEFSDNVSPEKICESKQITESINQFLETLSKNDRIMFVRRHWYGYSVKDIANQFSITPHNATVKLNRIVKKLKTYLQKEGLV